MSQHHLDMINIGDGLAWMTLAKGEQSISMILPVMYMKKHMLMVKSFSPDMIHIIG